MRCPFCGASHLRVVDTSADSTHQEIRRRRQCQKCGRRFSTVERVRAIKPMVVKERADGTGRRREPFNPEKLRRGLQAACAKRPISPAAIDRLVASIEAHVMDVGIEEIPSHEIGELVIAGLSELDEVAYLRYAIVFLGLEDLTEVQAEIDRLMAQRTRRRPRWAGAQRLSGV